MKCNHCGAENEKGSVFCEECGQKIEIIESPKNLCPHCGAENDEGAVFCDNCGQRMDAVPAAEPVPEPEPEPQKNLCPHCGAENEDGAVFCDNCGQKMTADAPVQTETPRPQPSTYTAPQPQVSRPAAITPEPAAPYSGGTAPIAAANGFFSNKRNVIIVAVAAFVIVALIITIIVIASNSGSSRSSYSGGGSSYSGGSSLSNSTTSKKTEKVSGKAYTYDDAEGEYTGEWSDGKPNGNGFFMYSSGDNKATFDGSWSDGRFTGEGEITAVGKNEYDQISKIYYKVNYKNDTITDGIWQLTNLTSGDFITFEGDFLNGEPYNGTYTETSGSKTSKGTVEKGEWKSESQKFGEEMIDIGKSYIKDHAGDIISWFLS